MLGEPFSGLDTTAHTVVADVFEDLRRNGTAIVFSEHRPKLARALATRTFRLAEGRLAPADAFGERAGGDTGAAGRTGADGAATALAHRR